jgi:hypothetical protein
VLIAAVALLVLLCAALAIVIRARRLPPSAPAASPRATWVQAAGDEFAELDDAERCDLIFAVAALSDERSHQLLILALDDPSESVALAAARELTRQGGGAALEEYLAAHPSERARTLRLLVEIFD